MSPFGIKFLTSLLASGIALLLMPSLFLPRIKNYHNLKFHFVGHEYSDLARPYIRYLFNVGCAFLRNYESKKRSRYHCYEQNRPSFSLRHFATLDPMPSSDYA